MSNESEADAFLQLSRLLTGEQRLSPELSEQYRNRISASFPSRMNSLLTVFQGISVGSEQAKEEIQSRIMADEELGSVAREVIMLWYMSGFRGPDANGVERELGPETPEQYYQGLLWPTIRAHPLGLSGGYFGYWHYPPEN